MSTKKNFAQDAEDDAAFAVPVQKDANEAAVQPPDPFEDLRKRNEMLNQFKERNKSFARDPFQIPVTLVPSATKSESFPSAKDTLERAFGDK
jgi:hypothetical protein